MERMPMSQPAPKSEKRDLPPSPGADIAERYLQYQTVGEPVEDVYQELVGFARNEFLLNARNAKNVPVATQLADLMRTDMKKLTQDKTKGQGLALYIAVMEAMTNWINREAKRNAVREAARNEGKKQRPDRII